MFRFFDLNSIRSRMVSGFFFLVFLILIVSIVSLYLLGLTQRVATVHSHINQLEIGTLILFKNDNDFFDLESTNENYFGSHSSHFLNRRDSLLRDASVQLANVLERQASGNIILRGELLAIEQELKEYNKRFLELEDLVYTKGFKNYGLEGVMRTHAHHLENEVSPGDMIQVLLLRRHEKDFFLRLDTSYALTFKQRASLFRNALEKNKKGNQSIQYHLDEYQRIFLALVEVHKRIGLTSATGLRNQLNSLTNSISTKYYKLSKYASERAYVAQQQAHIIFSILIVCAILFSIVSGIWISKRLSEPIARLSKHMEGTNLDSVGPRINYDLRNSAIEIQTLSNTFNRLLENSEAQMTEIRAKSKLLKKKNKELKRLNKELDNFLYSTAHDLRSPLTSLQGLFNLLAYDHEKTNVDGYLTMMRASVDRMEDFISQIVSYSKNKRVNLRVEKVNLDTTLRAVFESHRFISGAENIEWYLNVKEHVPAYTDLSRLTILLNNLISNGIKYADHAKEKPFIRFRVHSDDQTIVIEYSDNGIGIAEEHLGRIFDMFYRAHTSSKGSGLGLYIFKQTVKKLKGTVKVESTQNSGTRFIISIPNYLQQQLEPDSSFYQENH